jgi:hypothetical protein
MKDGGARKSPARQMRRRFQWTRLCRDIQKKTGLPKQPSFNSVMVCLTYRPMPTTWPWLMVYALPPMLTVGT